MVRLMLALAPIICILAAISLSTTIETILAPDDEKNQIEEILEVAEEATEDSTEDSKEGAEENAEKNEAKKIMVKVKKTPWTEYLKNEIFFTKWISLILVASALGHYAYHSEYVIEKFYSSPSIILTGRVRGNEGSGLIEHLCTEMYEFV
jgi:predicted alpha/beta hydrolase family esterase